MSVVGIGLGHAVRSEAVYRYINKKARTKILTYSDSYNYYKHVNIPSANFSGQVYKGYEYSFDILLQIMDFFKSPTKLKKEYERFKKIADKFKPDIVFSDSEPNAFFYAVNRSLPNYTLTNLITTMVNYKHLPRKFKTKEVSLQNVLLNRLMKFMLKKGDELIVPSFESNVEFIDRVNYTDLIVRQKPSELESDKKLKNKLGIDREFYYVHVGGAEIERYILPILESILSSFKDKFFVISSNYATNKVIKKDNMIIYPFIKNASEYIKLSNGVISPAGHSSISEGIVYKKPMLVIPIRNHVEQLVNAFLLKKEGFGEACFFEKRISAKALKKSLISFFNKEDVFDENLKKTKFKGNGARQIAKLILN